MAFDLAKFMNALKADPQLKRFDLVAFEQRYRALLGVHGKALDEMAAHLHEIVGASRRAAVQLDPEKLREEILQRELSTTGIDWRRFYAGRKDERDLVNRHLQQHKLSFTADELLSGTAKDSQSDAHPEYVTPDDAQNLINVCHGDVLKNAVISRADSYQQIKSAANANDTMSTIMGMLNGGILAFGPDAAKAAIHAMGAGGALPTAIAAGIAFLGLDVVGLIVTAIFILLWVVVLLLTPCTLTGMVLNWTRSGLAFEDPYTAHGDDIITTDKPSASYPGTTQIAAAAFINIPDVGSAVSIGYFYQKGAQISVVGVQAALRLGLYRPTWDAGSTGLDQNHIYTGWVIPKFGSSHALIAITGDASSQAFYDGHSFPTNDTSAEYGPFKAETRLSDYSYAWSSRDNYQFSYIKQSS